MKFFLFLIISLCASQTLLAHGISESDKLSMVEGGLIDYIGLGATHMLTGYDHLLFLFGVIFFLKKFKEIVQFITAFTVGHCITLIFATFMGISANYFLIDAVIALTVIYKGFDNLDGFQKCFKIKSPNLLVLVFIFGLIHGFGLSARLQQLPLGEEGLLLKILSFNLGVELGQIAALSVMLILLNVWRKRDSFQKFSNASNIGLVLAGFGLFAFQMYGYFTEEPEHNYAIPTVEVQPQNDVKENEWQGKVTISVPPGQSLEYKFLVSKGVKLFYHWQTDGGKLYFDFHGDHSTNKSFKSYHKSTSNESRGILTPSFDGSHGWYWKNSSSKTVKLTIRSKGDYKILGFQ